MLTSSSHESSLFFTNFIFFFLITPPPPISTLFPYTTLFRSLFTNAILEASPASPNIIWERKWVENHVRYGIVNDIGQEVVEELSASYDKERLDQLVKHAFQEEDSGDIQEIEAKNKIKIGRAHV